MKCARQVAEDLHYDAIKKKVEENVYTHCFVSPDVTTFTSDLRGNVAPEIYGWTPMPTNLKNAVRNETLLVLRAAEILDIFAKFGLPWIIENPSASEPDLFAMPEFIQLLNSYSGVSCTKFYHCPDARHSTGVTRILGKFGLLTCAQNYFSGPGENCSKSCEHWAITIARALCEEVPSAPAESTDLTELPGDMARPAINFTTRLRSVQPNAKESRAQEDKMALAGVRNAAEDYRVISSWEKCWRHSSSIPCVKTLAYALFLSLWVREGVDPEVLPMLSEELDQLIIPARENLANILSCTDTGTVNNDQCSTETSYAKLISPCPIFASSSKKSKEKSSED